MFRAEDCIQRNPRCFRQHINRPTPFRINAGLIGQQPNPPRGPRPPRMQGRKVRLLQHIDAGLHRSIPRCQLARRALHLAISGNRTRPYLLRFQWVKRQRRRHGRGDLRPQRNRASLLMPRHRAHVHRIRQQHNVGIGRRVDPQRSPRIPSMSKPAHRKEFPAIG